MTLTTRKKRIYSIDINEKCIKQHKLILKDFYMNTCMVVNKHAEDHSGKYTNIHKHTIMKLNAHLTSRH